MTSQRQGFAPSTLIHENKYGTNQSGEYIRVVVHNADNDFSLAQHDGGAIHDTAYISLP
jgi:hypothetical protein